MRRRQMTDSVALGVNGLSIPPGSHICAFFRGVSERDEIMIPFLREGLSAGNKCMCIIDDDVDGVRTALGVDAGVPADVERGQLEIRSSKETYLRRGTFSTREMLDFWDESVDAALNEDGFPFVRSTGETTWMLKELPGLYDFMTYEAELNRFLPRYPQVILCLYDLDHFGGQILVDILKTHPRVLMGGTVLENLHYLEPDEFLASRA
jgi:MEDS: MEthanogen/methylotroph, DcmR Sensory domain